MNKKFFPILTILGLLIIYLLVVSCNLLDIKIAGYALKKNTLKEYFSAIATPEKKPLKKKRKPINKLNLPPKVIPDTSSQRILIIGDSMLEGLGPRLNDYCEENNHTLGQIVWYSSNSKWYGSCDTIPHFIERFKPTYIILAIGSGDIIAYNAIVERKPYVEKILEQVKGYKYIWVGPPNWREDSGINELIDNSVKERTFFLSKDLSFERVSDGVHPTRESASKWMDTIASFIMNKSSNPIMLKIPKKKAEKRPTVYMLSPKPPVL